MVKATARAEKMEANLKGQDRAIAMLTFKKKANEGKGRDRACW